MNAVRPFTLCLAIFFPLLGFAPVIKARSLGVVTPGLTSASSDQAGAHVSSTKKDEKKKEPEKERTILGVTINRPDGRFLGLDLRNTSFVLSFYDAKKKPEKTNLVRATARWQPLKKPGMQLSVLLPETDGMSMVGNKPVLPPYNFKVFLVLMDSHDAVAESYVVDFANVKQR